MKKNPRVPQAIAFEDLRVLPNFKGPQALAFEAHRDFNNFQGSENKQTGNIDSF